MILAALASVLLAGQAPETVPAVQTPEVLDPRGNLEPSSLRRPQARIRHMGSYLEAVVNPGQGVFIRAYDGRWYYAGLTVECPRLTRSASLRFETSPGGRFDRNSAIRADGWLCLVSSVTEAGGLPDDLR